MVSDQISAAKKQDLFHRVPPSPVRHGGLPPDKGLKARQDVTCAIGTASIRGQLAAQAGGEDTYSGIAAGSIVVSERGRNGHTLQSAH